MTSNDQHLPGGLIHNIEIGKSAKRIMGDKLNQGPLLRYTDEPDGRIRLGSISGQAEDRVSWHWQCSKLSFYFVHTPIAEENI